jgi:hypothetical protein
MGSVNVHQLQTNIVRRYSGRNIVHTDRYVISQYDDDACISDAKPLDLPSRSTSPEAGHAAYLRSVVIP